MCEKVKVIYEMVEFYVDYNKFEGGEWGWGDVVWVCDLEYGNCIDFYSLFILFCCMSFIFVWFEIGFLIFIDGGEVGGYYCWVLFEYDGYWIFVDILEVDKYFEKYDFFFGNLIFDWILFLIGRDLIFVFL